MVFVGYDIVWCPGYLFLKSMLSNLTIADGADWTREVFAGIHMYKEFHGLAKLMFDQVHEFFRFLVGFLHVEIPGNGKMTIHMQHRSEFNNAEIMDIDPVRATVMIQEIYQFRQDFLISLVHDACDGLACDAISNEHDDEGHDMMGGESCPMMKDMMIATMLSICWMLVK